MEYIVVKIDERMTLNCCNYDGDCEMVVWTHEEYEVSDEIGDDALGRWVEY